MNNHHHHGENIRLADPLNLDGGFEVEQQLIDIDEESLLELEAGQIPDVVEEINDDSPVSCSEQDEEEKASQFEQELDESGPDPPKEDVSDQILMQGQKNLALKMFL